MMQVPDDYPERDWYRAESALFRVTTEKWGGLSNMAAGFPVTLGGTTFRTSEALYQALRFPGLPDVQQMIAEQASPMTAKMKSKPFRRNDSHPDWERIRVSVMSWCLRLKLAQNWSTFGQLLASTAPLYIVEESTRDRFWGAVPYGDRLKGSNTLGVLLAFLRDTTDLDGEHPTFVAAPGLGLRLGGAAVPNWEIAAVPADTPNEPPALQQWQLNLDL